jgi:hypothetical protein
MVLLNPIAVVQATLAGWQPGGILKPTHFPPDHIIVRDIH